MNLKGILLLMLVSFGIAHAWQESHDHAFLALSNNCWRDHHPCNPVSNGCCGQCVNFECVGSPAIPNRDPNCWPDNHMCNPIDNRCCGDCVMFGCSGGSTPKPPPKPKGPIYSPGYTDPIVCERIYREVNGDWLPGNYIKNAICACQSIPTSSFEGNCIRQFLAERLQDQNRYSQNFKQHMTKKEFASYIYQDHVEAYKQCGCKGTPAPEVTWKQVVSHVIPCFLTEETIRWLGSCHASNGSW